MLANVQLHFIGNNTIQLEVNLDDWMILFDDAVRENEVVYIRDREEGRILAINSRLVTHWKHCP